MLDLVKGMSTYVATLVMYVLAVTHTQDIFSFESGLIITMAVMVVVIMIMKLVPRETQKLCSGCSKAEPKIFAPPQTPFSGAQDGQNLISWRWSLPLPTNPVW